MNKAFKRNKLTRKAIVLYRHLNKFMYMNDVKLQNQCPGLKFTYY